MRIGIEVVLLSTARLYFGFTSLASSYTATEPSAAGDLIGIGADSGDANITVFSRDNTTTTKTALSTTLAKTHAASTIILDLTISCAPNASVIHVTLVDSFAGVTYFDADISANLPRTSQVLRPMLSVNTGSAAHSPAPAYAVFGDQLFAA